MSYVPKNNGYPTTDYGGPGFAAARPPALVARPGAGPLGDVFSDVTGTLQTVTEQINQIGHIRENTDQIKHWMPWATAGLFFVGSGLVLLAFVKRR